VSWNGDISGHGALLRAERASARLGKQSLLIVFGQLDAHVRTEQAHEHVAVHEHAKVAEAGAGGRHHAGAGKKGCGVPLVR
jgi:hypothetical protein